VVVYKYTDNSDILITIVLLNFKTFKRKILFIAFFGIFLILILFTGKKYQQLVVFASF